MIQWRSITTQAAVVVILAAAALPACLPGSGSSVGPNNAGPTVQVMSPIAGREVPAGQEVLVTSQSSDPDGIQRVELWADGTLSRTDVNPVAESPYVVAQGWRSDRAGSHVFIVKAYDARGNVGQSDPVVITVSAASPPTSVVQFTPAPSATRPPTSTTTPLPPPTLTAAPQPTATSAPPTVTPTPMPVCTPPPCQAGEVYYCADNCPGGCGTECATPTPTPTRPTFAPTDFAVYELLQAIWDKPEVSEAIGYPTELASDTRRYARQYFDRGYMYWWDRPDAPGVIWVVQMPDASAMSGFGWIGPFDDTWDGDDPISCEAANQTAYGPRSGFGRLWCDHPEIAQTVGFAREAERGTGESADYGVVQTFQGGTILYSPLDREVWVLVNGGAWQRYFR